MTEPCRLRDRGRTSGDTAARRRALPDPLQQVHDALQARDPGKPKLHQAVDEILASLGPELNGDTGRSVRTLLALLEPERQVSFRVVWEDDDHQLRVNRGFRVQQNGLLGPYKGGLRFVGGLDADTLRFLAFEQTFKNALTGLGMGGAKGGADVDARALSERERRRFCVAFIHALAREIGPMTDVPAGDIGVGSREVGWMAGALRRRTRHTDGTLTGKPLSSGGVKLRTEATGYGLVYFADQVLAHDEGQGFDGRRVRVSGSGNVALHAAEKATALGAKVVTLSSRRGVAVCADGFSQGQFDALKAARAAGTRLAAWCAGAGVPFEEGVGAWSVDVAAEVALPCAVENELDAPDVAGLVDAGVRLVAEGANMPTTAAAIAALHEAGVSYAPGKAANAGGVAVSGLEMRQNASRTPLSRDAVDRELVGIMSGIHGRLRAVQAERPGVRLADAANIAAFRVLREAAVDQGLV